MAKAVSIKSMTARQLETFERVLHAVSLSRRHGVPVDAAAREVGTTLKTVLKYARPALKPVGDKWMARASDRLERPLLLYDEKGSYQVTIPSSAVASRISDYHRAVKSFVGRGDAEKLRPFKGKFVLDVDGKRHHFLTDPDILNRLKRAGEFRFTSIY